MAVTHLSVDKNANFAEEWILLINRLTEIHQRYPEYTILTLKNAQWLEWTE